MKVELEVLASTSIKRKKPWPRMAFLGQAQESLFLMDSQRLSTLYIPSGRTKRKIPKISSLLPDVVTMNFSQKGIYLGGMLKSGDAFIWHKDKDMLKFIPGLPAFGGKLGSTNEEETGKKVYSWPMFTLSDDGTKILIVINGCEVYLWEKDHNRNQLMSKANTLQGSWSRIMPADSQLPSFDCRECSNSVMFSINEKTTGYSCICSFSFYDGNQICVTTLVLRWFETQDIYSYRQPTYSAEWSSIRHSMTDISPHAMPIRTAGALVSSFSHDSSLLAVAVNQFDSYQNKVLFVSPWTDTTMAVDMKGAGSKTPIIRHARWYWIADMQWTPNDLFVVCISKQGALCILSRLGEPLLLQTHGNSIEMGPKLFLPLHPLIVVKGTADEYPDSHSSKDSGYEDEADPMRQMFSVCTHPSQPIICCSDGYMVTVMAMPSQTTCLSMMQGLVTEANRHLRHIQDQQNLQMSTFEATRRQKTETGKGRNVNFGGADKRMGLFNGGDSEMEPQSIVYKGYTFEQEPDEALDGPQDSDVEDVDPKGEGIMANIDLSMGKIGFGDEGNMNCTLDFAHFFSDKTLDTAEEINLCQKNLLLAWALAASHSGAWTVDHEDVTCHLAHDLAKLLTILLYAPPEVLKGISITEEQRFIKKGKWKRKRNLLKVLSLFQAVIHLLTMDGVNRHVMISAFRFVNATVETVMNYRGLNPDLKMQNLYGCFMILKLSENIMGKAYSSVPRGVHVNGVPYPLQSFHSDVMDPVIFSKIDAIEVLKKDSDKVTEVERQYTVGTLEPTDNKSVDNLPELCCLLNPCKRLANTWKLLLKHSQHHYKALLNNLLQITKKSKVKKLQQAELERIVQLIVVLQWKMKHIDTELPHKTKSKLIQGDQSSIGGSTILAVHSWIHCLENTADTTLGSGQTRRVLHAVLYSYLIQHHLRIAMDLVELLIRQGNVKKAMSVCKRKEDSRQAILSLLLQDFQKIHELPNTKEIYPPVMLKSKPARHTVQTMARLMAAYFSNQTLFLYPPHCPRRLPPLHTAYKIDYRIHPLDHETLTSSLRKSGLGDIWTPVRTLEYLMVGGLMPEAVWFVHNLGDWKAAFFMGVALNEHEKSSPELYEWKKKLCLPIELQPQVILQEQLKVIFDHEASEGKSPLLVDENTDINQLTKTLSDLLLAATICQIDIVPWLLDHLAVRLRSLCHRLAALVPEGVYLPAPPVYCPQPTVDNLTALSQDAQAEVQLRRELSSIIILIQLVLNGSHTTIPAAVWYVQNVMEAFAKGLKFKRAPQKNQEIELDIHVLQSTYLSCVSLFQGLEINPSVNLVLETFRDLCSVTWMMHARDKLSLCLRKKAQLAEKRIGKTGNVSRIEWLAHCKKTLQWALHMIPFSHCLQGAENTLYGTLISLIIELPPTEISGKVLAEHFYDVDSLNPEIQDKVQWITKEWQGIFLDAAERPGKQRNLSNNEDSPRSVESPRGMTLSLYYQEQAQKMEKVLRRKYRTFGRYEEFVYVSNSDSNDIVGLEEGGVRCIGSRPFESTEEYLQFLDVFYDVAFHQVMDGAREEKGEPPVPLLLEYANVIREQELSSLPHRAVTRLQKKQKGMNKVQLLSPRGALSPRVSKSARPEKTNKIGGSIPPSTSRKGGLFKSRSFSDIRFDRRKKKTSISFRDEHVRSLWQQKSFTQEFNTQIPNTWNKHSVSGATLSSIHEPNTNGKLEKSSSEYDIRKQLKIEEDKTDALANKSDPLTEPVVPEWLLDNMKFEPKWNATEELLQWLYRWSNRNHMLISANQYQSNPQNDTPLAPGKTKSAMKIRVPPRMVMYSLWLLENVYYPDPNYASQAQVPSEPVEITVAMVRREDDGAQSIQGNTLPNTERLVQPRVTAIREDTNSFGEDGPPHNSSLKGGKAKKKKKKDKKREKLDESDPNEVQKVTTTVTKTSRKLSFRVPEPDTDSRQSSARSESTLNVSSLVDEDLLNETVAGVVRQHLGMSSSSVEGPCESPSMQDANQSSAPRREGSRHPTDAPVLTGTDLGAQLQAIVRNEMKRIMEAQQQGIVAMLGALDQQQAQPNQQAYTHPGTKPTQSGHSTDTAAKRNTDSVVMTVQANVHPRQRADASDVDVTPIPSDDLTDESKSSAGKPMTLADLNKETLASQQRFAYRSGQPLHGALREMESLENQYGGIPSLGMPPPGYFNMTVENKENDPQTLSLTADRGPIKPASTQPSYYQGQSTVDGQPFGRLMGILRGMNEDLRAPVGKENPAFLSLKYEKIDSNPVRFPPLQAWPEPMPRVNQLRDPGQTARLDLIHNHYYQEAQQKPDKKVEAPGLNRLPKNRNLDQRQTDEGFVPFPLLKLHGNQEYHNIETSQGIRLIPPDEIIKYEQKKYQGRTLSKKQLKDFLRKETELHQLSKGKEQQHPGVCLLKADFEPFGYADERDNKKRQRRRQKQSSIPPKSINISHSNEEFTSRTKEDILSDSNQEDLTEDSIEGSLPETVVTLSSRSSPRKTPGTPQKEGHSANKGEELHHGYAITPGLFDDYLDKDKEMGSALDSNARIQYQAATGKSSKKCVLRKDAACDTNGAMIDAATAISKDAGSDPVSDALQKYYRAKTGHSAGILPPDIFLGLKFNDTKTEDSQGTRTGQGGQAVTNERAFLSVVDIGSDLLDELPPNLTNDPSSKLPSAPGKAKTSNLKKAHRQKGRVEFKEPEVETGDQRPPGPDSVTVHLLDNDRATLGFKMPSEDEISKGHRFRSKESIRQNLSDMNLQFNAIASMAQNIESDLKSTKMLVNTIEQIGEAIHPSAEISTPSEGDLDDEGKEHEIYKNRSHLKPSEVKKYRKHDSQAGQAPIKSQENREDYQTPNERIKNIQKQLGTSQDQELNPANTIDVSGLSGVSDIVGELLATGDIDSKKIGLSQRDHNILVDRALQSAREGTRLSSEELKKIFQDQHAKGRSDKENKELHEWMEKKKYERSKEYRDHLATLREAERAPYISHLSQEGSLIRTGSLKEIQDAEIKREERREKRIAEAIEKRKKEASDLMGTILSDQVNLPRPEPTWAWDETPVKGESATTHDKVTSSSKTTGMTSKKKAMAVQQKFGTAPRARFVAPSPVRGENTFDNDSTHVYAEDYIQGRVRPSQHNYRRREPVDTTKQSATTEWATRPTNDSLQAYTKHLENMDTGEWQDTTPRPQADREPEMEPEGKQDSSTRPYKPKSFKSMVRLQRPEVTRGKKPLPRPTNVYRQEHYGSAEHTDRSTGSRREKEKLYGSKRLPGTYKANERRAPRQVKTYQQRLAEMKSSRSMTRPFQRTYVSARKSAVSHQNERYNDTPNRRVNPRKTMTYAQQLQQLQPPKELQRTGESDIPLQGTFIRQARRPANKPKTYVQQLQELQPTAPAMQPGPSRPKVHHLSSVHGIARQRPYADPYSDLPQDDLSAVSPWSMDDDVRGILYDEASESLFNPASGAATDYDISELTDLDYLGEHYTDLVEVQDLTASFSSGSIMSFIDWDAVEHLIADVK